MLAITLVLLGGCSTGSNPGTDPGEEPGQGNDEGGIEVSGALVLHQGNDFSQGTFENTELKNGNIVLKDGATQGSYESPLLLADAFRELVASWNAETPIGSEVELLVQVRIEDAWSPWLSYGKWASGGNQGSVTGESGNYANMNIDVVEVVMGKEADALRYRVLLTGNESGDSPVLRTVAASLRLWNEVKPVLDPGKEWEVELDVPERSQMIVPGIGNVICSPTSLSMVLEYYGHDYATEAVAANARDNRAGIYGNWAYNVAYAGSLGLTAYVDRFVSSDQLKEKIADGIPVVCSINTKSQDDLEGAPMAYPSGHLVVVRGFTVKDGVEYVIVNDPAAPDNDSVRREYKLTQFERAWRKIVYIITE